MKNKTLAILACVLLLTSFGVHLYLTFVAIQYFGEAEVRIANIGVLCLLCGLFIACVVNDND